MALRLHVDAVDPDRPEAAARAACAGAVDGLARARGLVLCPLETGDRPGAALAPWTVTGVLDAVDRAGFARRSVECLDLDGRLGRTRRALLDRGIGELDRGRRLTVSPARARGRARVPEALVGRNLALVLPLGHARRSDGSLAGPLSAALARLAHELGLTGVEAERRAAEAIVEVTAATVAIVDAGWWAVVEDPGAAARLHPIGRVAATAALSDPDDVLAIDDWLARKLGVPGLRARTSAPVAEPVVVGAAAFSPWPRPSTGVPSARPGAAAIFVRTLAAVRPRPGGARPRALPRPVPGPLAPLWDHYAETR